MIGLRVKVYWYIHALPIRLLKVVTVQELMAIAGSIPKAIIDISRLID
jgi:hypothetical protein